MVLGAHTDLDALRRAATGADALTFDHEHVPTDLLEQLVAEGVTVAPPPDALIHAQDKLVMRRRLEALGAPVPRFRRGDGGRRRRRLRRAHRRSGRGQDRPRRLRRPRSILARDVAEARDAVGRYLADGVAVLVEERVAMQRELSALVARSPFGQGAAWPIVETVQRDGICVEVIAPAPGLAPELGGAAEALGLRLAEELGVVGVLAVELFETSDGGAAGQRVGDAPAQLRALDHGRRQDQPVRTAPARGAGLPARCDRADRALHRDGQRARRTARHLR